MARISSPPMYTMERHNRRYKVYSGSITVTNVHTIGFIFGQHEGMVLRQGGLHRLHRE